MDRHPIRRNPRLWMAIGFCLLAASFLIFAVTMFGLQSRALDQAEYNGQAADRARMELAETRSEQGCRSKLTTDVIIEQAELFDFFAYALLAVGTATPEERTVLRTQFEEKAASLRAAVATRQAGICPDGSSVNTPGEGP